MAGLDAATQPVMAALVAATHNYRALMAPPMLLNAAPRDEHWLQRATALLDAGDAHRAWRAARRAVLHAPNSVAARRLLGRTLLAVGLTEQAVEALTKAAELAGNDAAAWFELGQTCNEANLHGAGAAAMRRALKIDPGHAHAAVALSRRIQLTGDDESAEDLLRTALQRTPHSSELRLELAALLRHDQPQESLNLLDAAGPPSADAMDSVALQRALTLIELARHAEARTTLDSITRPPAGQMLPLLGAQLQLAVAENDPAAAQSIATQLANALHRPAEDPDRRIAAHFQLSQYRFRHDEPDAAFALLAAGHALARQAQPYERETDAQLVEASVAHLTHERLHHGARASTTDPTPVFIVGMPRSGTTLAEQILAAHPMVHGAGERTTLARAFLRLGKSDDIATCLARLAALEQPELDAEAARYLTALHALAPDRARIVDKMPANYRFLGLVALLLPGARIIHCVRDPRDIGFSIWSRRFRGSHPYAHDMRDLGWYIGQHYRLMRHWHAALPNPIMTIHLHEWIHRFDNTLRRVLDFLDLPYDAACERFHELDRPVRTASRNQVREAVNARGMSRWRPYAAQLMPLIEALQEAGALPS